MSKDEQNALQISLKSHALIRPTGLGSFAFRFDYLVQLAPAAWVCNYILEQKPDAIVEKYLAALTGRSSPVSAFVADSLKERDWKALVRTHVYNNRHRNATLKFITPLFWGIAQSLLPPPGQGSRHERSQIMSEIFGTRGDSALNFTGLHFSGPLVYMDFRSTLFKESIFQNCEWINCEAGHNTKFESCNFRGRFVSVQSGGLRSAAYEPLTEQNVDGEARADFAGLLVRPDLVTVSETAVVRMTSAILRPFRASGFFVPRTKDFLTGLFLEPAIVRKSILDKLIENAVLEEVAGRGLQIVKKNNSAVNALLDNTVQRGAVKITIAQVVNHFRQRQAL